MTRGTLISFEGPDGSGKSTLAQSFYDWLVEHGYDAILTKQPGGSERCMEIRTLMLNREPGQGFCNEALLALFYADRFQHLHDVLEPALKAGKIVVSDRSELSTYAYQIHAPNKHDILMQLFEDNHRSVRTRLGSYECRTYVCQLTVEEADRRIATRAADAGEVNFFDKQPRSFKLAVHEGMSAGQKILTPAYEFVTVDAMQTKEEMLASVVQDFLSSR